MKRIVLLLAAAYSGSAQMISVGVKGGAVLSDSLSQQSIFTSATSGTWTGGPTVELHLPYRLSIEIDALYHGSRETTTYPASFPINANGDSSRHLFVAGAIQSLGVSGPSEIPVFERSGASFRQRRLLGDAGMEPRVRLYDMPGESGNVPPALSAGLEFRFYKYSQGSDRRRGDRV